VDTNKRPSLQEMIQLIDAAEDNYINTLTEDDDEDLT